MLKALQCWAVDIPTCPLKGSACELADLGSSFHFYKEGHGNSLVNVQVWMDLFDWYIFKGHPLPHRK